MANYFLTEELYGEIRRMLAWYRQQLRRGNADPRALDHEEHPTPDVYIARTGASGIPASSINFTATGTGTGSDLQEGPLGHGECVIYRADTYAAIPKLLSMGFTKEVYNLSETVIPPWSFIKVTRDKAGTWWADPTAELPASLCSHRYRYFCTGGVLKEYDEDCFGVLTFLRNVGCCECTTITGTGTSTQCLACSLATSLCVDLGTVVGDLGNCGLPPARITVTQVGTTEGTTTWYGTAPGTSPGIPVTWYASFKVTCGLVYGLVVDYVTGAAPDLISVCGYAGFIPDYSEGVPVASFCSLPQTIRIRRQMTPNNPAHIDAVISSGVCAGDFTGTGTSGGNCPCLWQYDGVSWNLLSGNALSCSQPPLIPTPTTGEIRSTHNDGTTCSGSGGGGSSGSSPACASIANTDGSFSTQNATGIFAATPTTGSMTANGGSTWTSDNTSGGKFYLACIDDRWWMTFDGLSYAVEATLFYGSLSFGFDFDDAQGGCRVIVVMNPA